MTTNNPNKEKTIITAEDALELIGPSESVHTFRSGGPILFGCDWSRESIVAGLENAQGEGIEVAGPQARKMNHAVVFYDDQGPVFVETLPGIVERKYPLT